MEKNRTEDRDLPGPSGLNLPAKRSTNTVEANSQQDDEIVSRLKTKFKLDEF